MSATHVPRQAVRSLNAMAMGGRAAQPEPRYGFYQEVMRALDASRIPFLIGGGFAFTYFTGIARMTKDLDLFILPQHFSSVMAALANTGFRTAVRFSHWLGKVFKGEDFVDIIFSSGNGLCRVQENWFEHAVPIELLGLPVKLCAPEEMIWTKAFVMERDRFDGADVAHLIHARGKTLDWGRLLRRFNDSHWRVLFSHLILFGFIYPSERTKIPEWVQSECLRRFRYEMKSVSPRERVCQGTLLSWSEYLPDIERWEYEDGRHPPGGNLTAEDTDRLTAVWKQGE